MTKRVVIPDLPKPAPELAAMTKELIGLAADAMDEAAPKFKQDTGRWPQWVWMSVTEDHGQVIGHASDERPRGVWAHNYGVLNVREIDE